VAPLRGFFVVECVPGIGRYVLTTYGHARYRRHWRALATVATFATGVRYVHGRRTAADGPDPRLRRLGLI
jgi:hypothetical protein